MPNLKLAEARVAFDLLKEKLDKKLILKASREWGGANVVVSAVPLYSSYREIITPYSLEVSWLFEQLRDVFSRLIDSESKFEFYGRLEVAVNRSIAAGQCEVRDVALGLLDAAETMLDEMSRRQFTILSVAMGNEIAADRVSK